MPALLSLRQGLLAACAGFFKWEPIKLQTALLPALFTIIAPGFTEEVPPPFHSLHLPRAPAPPVALPQRKCPAA